MNHPQRTYEALPLILLVTAIMLMMGIDQWLIRLSLISVVCSIIWRFAMRWFLGPENHR